MMSPGAALQDPVFRAYLVIVPATLAAGGLVLAVLQFLFRKELGAVWRTYFSWLMMAAFAFAAVFAGRIATIAGVTLLGILAFRELARSSGLDRDRWMTGVVYAGILAVGLSSLISDPRRVEPTPGCYGFFAAIPAFAIGLILLVPILRNRARGELQKIALAIIGFLYLGWLFGHLGFLANTLNAYGFLGYVIFATGLSDVAAYTFGKLFGRHPLRSEISPKKTCEGAFGAFAVAMIAPWLLRFSFPFFGTWQLILSGLIVGIGGQLGDLSISLLKRELGTKDMGTAIPGHGGIVDRIDSLIFVAPLFMHMADYYYKLR